MPVINKPVVNMGNAAVTEFVDSVNTTDTAYTFLESYLRDYFKIENVGTNDLVVTVAGSSYTLKQGEKKELNSSYSSFSVRAATNTAAFRVRASYFVYDEVDEKLLNDNMNGLNESKYSYSYLPDGSVQTITEKTKNDGVISTTTFTYKANGDVDTSTLVKNGVTITTQYIYDANGNLTDTVNTKG